MTPRAWLSVGVILGIFAILGLGYAYFKSPTVSETYAPVEASAVRADPDAQPADVGERSRTNAMESPHVIWVTSSAGLPIPKATCQIATASREEFPGVSRVVGVSDESGRAVLDPIVVDDPNVVVVVCHPSFSSTTVSAPLPSEATAVLLPAHRCKIKSVDVTGKPVRAYVRLSQIGFFPEALPEPAHSGGATGVCSGAGTAAIHGQWADSQGIAEFNGLGDGTYFVAAALFGYVDASPPNSVVVGIPETTNVTVMLAEVGAIVLKCIDDIVIAHSARIPTEYQLGTLLAQKMSPALSVLRMAFGNDAIIIPGVVPASSLRMINVSLYGAQFGRVNVDAQMVPLRQLTAPAEVALSTRSTALAAPGRVRIDIISPDGDLIDFDQIALTGRDADGILLNVPASSGKGVMVPPGEYRIQYRSCYAPDLPARKIVCVSGKETVERVVCETPLRQVEIVPQCHGANVGACGGSLRVAGVSRAFMTKGPARVWLPVGGADVKIRGFGLRETSLSFVVERPPANDQAAVQRVPVELLPE